MELQPLHGGQLRQIAERFRIPVSELLDFSANVNPSGPPASVVSHLRASLDDPSVLANYPDLEEIELRTALAGYAGVRRENVAVANGFVPLLDAVLRVLPIRRCLVPVPAFVEYRKTLERSGVEIIPHLLTAGSGFRCHEADLFKKSPDAKSPDAILIANPQNPSGGLLPRETMLRIVNQAAERKIQVLLDEAFIDYCPETSLAGDIGRFSNLIVFRSATKFFGMAGLRVAFTIGDPGLSKRLREAIAPWSVTTLASRAAAVAVEDKDYAHRTIALNNARRDRMQTAIQKLGFDVYPSAANFLLLRIPNSIDCGQLWERLVCDQHIVVRHCSNYEGLDGQHLRVAVRTDSENESLTNVLAWEVEKRHGIQRCDLTPRQRPSQRPVLSRTCLISLILVACALSLPAQAKPRRIVSTAPSITETLFSLGLGDKVVGVSQFCNDPPEVRKLPKVGSFLRPDPEAIARLAPDLVVLQPESSDLTEELNALHIASIKVPHTTLEDIYTEIQLIGSAAGVPDRAAALVANISGSLRAIQSRAKALPSPRVLVIVDRQQGTLNNLTAVGPNNYVNQILEIAGGNNVLAHSGMPQYPRISLETVLRENPDVIIDLSGTQETNDARRMSRAATLALWGQYRDLAAVRAGRVYAGTADSLVVPGPRTPIATQRLFDFVHGIGGSD